MAKECEVTAKTYEEIRVLPAALKSSGAMQQFNKTLGFYITDTLRTAAGVHIPNQEATLIIQSESVTVTKKSGEVWAAGEPIFWLSGTTEFTNVNDGSGLLVGKVKDAAGSGAATGDINFRDYYPVQRGLQLGTAQIPYKIAASDPLIQLLTSSIAAAGTVRCANIELVQGILTVGIIEAFKVKVSSEFRTGAWTNAIVGAIDYGTDGDSAGGMASAVVGEMNLPNRDMHTLGGGYYCFEAGINAPANLVAMDETLTRPIAFLKLALWGDGKAEVEEKGFLFHLDGVSTYGDGLFDSTTITLANATDIVFDATFRINVDGVEYFIPAATDRLFVA